MAMYLYDPRYNTSQPITYDKIEAITGIKKGTLMTYKSRRLLIMSINCYIIDDKTPLKVRKELYAKQVIENEIWRPINHQYSVSDHGRFKKKYKRDKETYIMPFVKKQSGYPYIKLNLDGKLKEYKVSHLVAKYFIGERPGYRIRHKNGIKFDCYAGNLEFITMQELGKLTGHKSNSKEIVKLCLETNEPLEWYRSSREAAKENYMSYQTVLENCHKRTKLAGGYHKFMFQEDYEKEFGQAY